MKIVQFIGIVTALFLLASCENDIKRVPLDGLNTDDIVAGDSDDIATDTPVGTDGDTPVLTDSDTPVGTDTEPNDDGGVNTDDIAIDDALPDDTTDSEPVDDEVVVPDNDTTVSTLCTDNGGTCVSGQPCPDGSTQSGQFTCEGGGFPPPVCCMPTTVGALHVEVTGPTPVDEALKAIAAVEPTPSSGGTGTPAIVSDIGPTALVTIGLLEDNIDGCKAFATTVTGSIVLVQRGNCTFSQKITNAANAGALAIIIYNNTQGELQMNADGTIPTVGITQADGEALITFTQAHPDITAAIRAQ
jgi:hypothetical protein